MTQQLVTEHLVVELRRDLGGKISQITQRAMRHRWLYAHPRLPWKLPSDLSDSHVYVRRADLGGWDECCPTVSSSVYPYPPFRGRRLVDHGDCWYQRPTEEMVDHTIVNAWEGRSLPFRLERRLRAEGAHLELGYKLRSQAHTPMALLWSAHPLFAIEQGMEIDIPAGLEMVVSSYGWKLANRGTSFGWPRCGDLDLTTVVPNAGWYVKLFSAPWPRGQVRLRRPSGEAFAISWGGDPDLRLGVWLNYAGASFDGGTPLQNLALEPCLGMPDALDEAMEEGTALVLEPDQERTWWIWIDVSPA